MTVSRARWWVIAIAAIVGLVGSFVWSRTVGRPPDPEVRLDQPGELELPPPSIDGVGGMPRVALRTPDGAAVNLAPDGRPMVVNLWNSTCAPCARELADFAAVDAAVGDRVRFVGVNNFDDADRMVSFASERGVDYELLVDDGSEFTDELDVAVLPVTLFVDEDGAVSVHVGALTDAELRAEISERWGIS